MRGEVTAWQPLDLESQFPQPFLREIDLPVFKRIFVAAADNKRELISISLKEATEVEPVALRFVIGIEARSCGGVEVAIVSAQGVVKLANLSVRDLVAFGPHHANRHLEQSEGTAQTSARPIGNAAQDWRGEPRVRVPVGKESAIEDENAAYLRPACRFTLL